MTPSTPDVETFLASLAESTRDPNRLEFSGPAQSLSHGPIGMALFHMERAALGEVDWQTVHSWIEAATAEPVTTSAAAGLYGGAPAVAMLLHAADTLQPGRYEHHVRLLADRIEKIVHVRIHAADERLRAATPSTFAEYDVFTGITGLGRLLMTLDPRSSAFGRVLEHLVALTRPLSIDRTDRPGWWVLHDPDPLLPTPGGHANLGIAHGICGPLALLSLARAQGAEVDGQLEAITAILDFLERHAVRDQRGTWWPQWIADAGHPHTHGHPPRPSWCYGTPGIARAVQLAALALGDNGMQREAENAIAAAVTHTAFMDQLTESGLCHGWAGTALVVAQAARQATSERLTDLLPGLVELLATGIDLQARDMGFLEGVAGVGLAAQALVKNRPSATNWESCLLIT